jgi:nitrate reductase gamma subunit
VPGARRHLLVHVGGALAAVSASTVLPALVSVALGTRWPIVLLPLLLAVPALVIGFAWKVGTWIRTPIPFRIPLTVGQQRGLALVPRRAVDNPHSTIEVVGRVLLDVLCFRPLWRATPTAPSLGRGLSHGMARWLWLLSAAFHGSLAFVLLRHLRLFLNPIPGFVVALESLDVATEMCLPTLHATSVVLLLALCLLAGRRLGLARIRYISLAADYLPLFLLLAIATTGMVMRHITRTDVSVVKRLAEALMTGRLVLPAHTDAWFVAHVCSVAVLLIYFPLSKLMHMPAALMSTTLGMANNNRERRYINVRNPKVETLHYADYEATFRERMIEAGLPVEPVQPVQPIESK